ncbi:hypothetical protein BDR07DRAFT_1387919 [Suillus spraguei]|nr:hypothetical protein BDR07DRAFT_1387919 [Suillus spraguei]
MRQSLTDLTTSQICFPRAAAGSVVIRKEWAMAGWVEVIPFILWLSSSEIDNPRILECQVVCYQKRFTRIARMLLRGASNLQLYQ